VGCAVAHGVRSGGLESSHDDVEKSGGPLLGRGGTAGEQLIQKGAGESVRHGFQVGVAAQLPGVHAGAQAPHERFAPGPAELTLKCSPG
jgi:hypothetical protein